jgi:hypothetical protein
MSGRKQPIGLGAGLAGICLVIVVAWALASVLMLTGTLTSATEINDRVKVINSALNPINYNLSFVKLAGHIGTLTKKINAAAQPLSGQAATILTTARSIDSKVPPILHNAQAINGVATSINSTVHSINTTVHGIGASVSSIGGSVASIGNSVAGIGADVGSIHSKVVSILGAVGPIGATDHSINGDVSQITPDFAGILSTAQSIRVRLAKVGGPGGQADKIINLASLIKGDFDGILARVGPGGFRGIGTSTIVGHANSIDCANIFPPKVAIPLLLTVPIGPPDIDCNGANP